jgi:hypothetical protein
VPDAIGWLRDTRSLLVECKSSMSDFYSDRGKPWRRHPEIGVGRERYYMMPPGVIVGASRQAEINIKREMKLLIDSAREENPIEREREAREARP